MEKGKAGDTGIRNEKQIIKIISFYDDSFLSAFYAYEWQFYDVFFFYRKA